MTTLRKAAARGREECCYGVDIAEDGTLVVVQRMGGRPLVATRHPAGPTGLSALREQIGGNPARPRVCIRSSGAAALALAIGLMPLARAEITLVAPRAIEVSRGADGPSAQARAVERARLLADLASRLV
jgi:hypothetical protein